MFRCCFVLEEDISLLPLLVIRKKYELSFLEIFKALSSLGTIDKNSLINSSNFDAFTQQIQFILNGLSLQILNKLVINEEYSPTEGRSESNWGTGPAGSYGSNRKIGSQEPGKSQEKKYVWNAAICNYYSPLFFVVDS